MASNGYYNNSGVAANHIGGNVQNGPGDMRVNGNGNQVNSGTVNGQGPGWAYRGVPQSTLTDQGIDAFGHPMAGPSGPYQAFGQPMGQYAQPRQRGHSRGQGIAQLASSIGSMELANQEDLCNFMEAYRSLFNYLAVTAHLAQGQLKAAARSQAKQSAEGWMTPAQRIKLGVCLKQVGKDIVRMADACVDGSTYAVKGWRRFEALLNDLQEDGSPARRPGGGRGGFSVVQ